MKVLARSVPLKAKQKILNNCIKLGDIIYSYTKHVTHRPRKNLLYENEYFISDGFMYQS